MNALVQKVTNAIAPNNKGVAALDEREYTLDELWQLAVDNGVVLRVWTYGYHGSPRSVHVNALIERREFKAELQSKDYPPAELARAIAEVLLDPRLGVAHRVSR